MNKVFRKLIYFKVFSIVIFSSIQAGNTAQEEPACFFVPSSGQTVNLDHICGRRNIQNSSPSLRTQETQALFQEGYSEARSGNYRDAIVHFNQAINLNPDFTEAYVARGYAQVLLNQYDAAIQDLERASQLYRNAEDIQRADSMQSVVQQIRNRVETSQNPSL
ncbi:MAG: tetratricopeptide repeat protein [Leptolyngbyaceae cyanobacterium RM2_2_4]|nr:tetratricopeptide repeat protein [Leptolyngbyaceae cyanobacterium SM1_4_3]NJO48360.1 tetratricopeptide repeat protein [Leptolyngbyaceae cyanobacterium RM2_2_4]